MSAPADFAAGIGREAAFREVRRRLAAAGLDDAALDARLLLCAAADVTPADLLARPDAPLGATGAARLGGFVARRLAGEPVSRILGRRGFWTLDLAVAADVLDPRPDTETLVEAALAQLGPRRGEALRLVDFGAGSGAIAAALLAELPAAFAVALDRAPAAARLARENLRRCGLADRAAVVIGDWDASLAGRFDLIVSNPPYIPAGDIAGLAPEVRLHDPRLALDGGPDGLDAYRRLAPAAARLLAPGGLVLFEVGAGQAAAVAALLAAAGLAPAAPARDLAGRERVAIARAPDG